MAGDEGTERVPKLSLTERRVGGGAKVSLAGLLRTLGARSGRVPQFHGSRKGKVRGEEGPACGIGWRVEGERET